MIDIRGKHVVLTGKFQAFGRKEAARRLEALGAICDASVTAKTDILFAGEKAGAKVAKASRFGIPIYGEGELLELLGLGNGAQPDPDGASPKQLFESGRARIRTNTPHQNEIAAFALSQDGAYLATGAFCGDDYDEGGELAIWEVASGRVVNVIERVQGGVGWPGEPCCVQWHRSGRRIGFSMDTNGVAWADPFTPRTGVSEVAYVTDGMDTPPAWCFSPEGTRVFISCWGDNDRIPGYIATPSPHRVQPIGFPPQDDIEPLPPAEMVRWTSENLIVCRGVADSYVLDVEALRVVWHRNAAGKALSPCGRRMVVAGEEVTLVDTASGELHVLTGQPAAEAYVFSPDSRYLGTLGERVRIFEGTALLATLPVEVAVPAWDLLDGRALAFSPDGSKVAVVTTDGRLQVWTVAQAPEKLVDIDGSRWKGVFYGAGDTVVAFSKEHLAFVDGSSGQARADHALFDSPAEDSLAEAYPGLLAFPVGGTWGYVVNNRLVVASADPSAAVHVAIDGRSARSIEWAGLPVFGSFEEAAKKAPKALGSQLARQFGGGKRSGKKRRKRLPFPEENEHTARDLEERLLERLLGDQQPFSYEKPLYLGELALHAFREGDIERAEDILSKVEFDIDAPTTMHAVAHVAAYLARDGAADSARRFVRATEAALERHRENLNPNFLARAMAWIGATHHALDGSAGSWLDDAAALDVMTADGGGAVMAMATAYAFVGDFSRAFETMSRLESGSWSVISELTALVLERWDLDLIDRFVGKLSADEIDGREQALARLVDTAIERGAARWAWERLEHFGEFASDRRRAEARIIDHIAATEGGDAVFEMIVGRLEEAARAGWGGEIGRYLVLATRREIEANREAILDYAGKVAAEAEDAPYNVELPQALTSLCALLPELGEMDRLVALFDAAPPVGEHWIALLEVLPKDHPRFAQTREHALASVDPYDQARFLRAVRPRTDLEPDVYEGLAQALLERAGRDRLRLEELTTAFARAGDLEHANLARMRITKRNRLGATGAMGREAVRLGHFSAGIHLLNELPDGYGSLGFQYEAMQALVRDCWDGINWISDVM